VSNQLFAFLLTMESVGLCVLWLLYFFNCRREPAAIDAAIVHALHAVFFFYIGGGAHDPDQAARFVYASALGLLFAKGAMGVLLVDRVRPRGDNVDDGE
jgi:hypothetical protein